ncbi:hypothetical protein ACJIZ3_018459 [Penstemon smallii]|uniref:Uncharacterized protein n=1 Tax=Penstemon smallii TaxID=265156 RepID=A0ABD3SZV3_9LAMI
MSNLEDAEEEEFLELEEEVETISQRILEYRISLPDQLSSTFSSLIASQRPVYPTHLVEQGNEAAGFTQGLVRLTESEKMDLVVAEEAGKIQLLKQKIASNATTMPIMLNKMKEYIAKIDKLESSNGIDGIIRPAFKRKRIS